MIAPKGHDISQIAPQAQCSSGDQCNTSLLRTSHQGSHLGIAPLPSCDSELRTLSGRDAIYVLQYQGVHVTKESTFDETVHRSIPPSTPQMGKVTKNFLVWAIPDIMGE